MTEDLNPDVENRDYTTVIVAIYTEEGESAQRAQSFTVMVNAPSSGVAEANAQAALGVALTQMDIDWEMMFVASTFLGKLRTVDHMQDEDIKAMMGDGEEIVISLADGAPLDPDLDDEEE